MVTKAEGGFPKSADELVDNYVQSMRGVLVASIAFTTSQEECAAANPDELTKKLGSQVAKIISESLAEAARVAAGLGCGKNVMRMAWISVLEKSIKIASGKEEFENRVGGIRTMAFELLSQAHAALRAAKGLGVPTHVDEVSEVAKKIDDYLDSIPTGGNAILDNVVYFEQSLWEALRLVSEAKKEASK